MLKEMVAASHASHKEPGSTQRGDQFLARQPRLPARAAIVTR
jgi:hypothetical protein